MDIKKDLRKSERLDLEHPVSYSTSTDLETDSKIINISPSGLLLLGAIEADVGEKVTLDIKSLGLFIGNIARKTSDRFAVNYELDATQRDDLKQIFCSKVIGVPYFRSIDKRRFDRKDPGEGKKITLQTGGLDLDCQIKDISENGIAFFADLKPTLGEIVQVGFLYGVVSRYTKDGFAISLVAAKQAI